jgi:biopolymer transport protein ExbD
MNFSNKKDKDEGILSSLTPLVDIVFNLLIFLMISSTFNFSESIKVNLPKAEGDEVVVKENVIVTVTSAEKIYVNNKFTSKSALFNTLMTLKKKHKGATLIISADRNSTHGTVMFVMDVSRKAGFENFAISVEEK